MNETEWLACDDPDELLAALRGTVSDRKVRLFAIAVTRHSPNLVAYEELEQAVDCGERMIDGPVQKAELIAARDAVAWGIGEMCESLNRLSEVIDVILRPQAVDTASAREVIRCVSSIHLLSEQDATGREGYPEQCEIVRDIFGNPFRPAALEPHWLTATVRDLAGAIYAERAYDRLPILADALEDAGCDDADILAHCRGDGPHVRGCWALDLILGKQ